MGLGLYGLGIIGVGFKGCSTQSYQGTASCGYRAPVVVWYSPYSPERNSCP